MCMRIPPGLLPKLVTSVNDAAAAGVAIGMTRPTAASDATAARESFRLILIAELLCSAGVLQTRTVRCGCPCTARVAGDLEYAGCDRRQAVSTSRRSDNHGDDA